MHISWIININYIFLDLTKRSLLWRIIHNKIFLSYIYLKVNKYLQSTNRSMYQPRPQAQPLPLRGYCVENTVGNARSGLAENAEKSVWFNEKVIRWYFIENFVFQSRVLAIHVFDRWKRLPKALRNLISKLLFFAYIVEGSFY